MAHIGTTPASTADKCQAVEGAFTVLYSRVDRHPRQMDDPNPSEYILDGLSKFAYSFTEYFQRWEDLAELLAEEKHDHEPWEKAKGTSPKVSAFANKVVEYAKSHKLKKKGFEEALGTKSIRTGQERSILQAKEPPT